MVPLASILLFNLEGEGAKVMWGNSRSVESRYGERGRKMAGRLAMKKWAVTALLAVFMTAAFAGSGRANLPAPSWMPGFPLLAGTHAILMWSPVPGAVKYTVYFNGKLLLKDLTVFQATTPGPEEGGEHKYEVAAVDAAGKEGSRSRAGVIKVIKLEAPTDLMLLPGEKQVQLRWGTTPGAVIYEAYRRVKGEGDYAMLGSVQDTRYTDSTAASKKVYQYAVKAKDITGKLSDFSAPAEAALVDAAAEGAAAASGSKTVIREFKINPVPTQRLEFYKFEDYPMDVAVGAGNSIAVAAGALYFSDEGVAGPFRVLAKGERGYNGVGFDPSGRKLYAANGATGEAVIIDVATGEAIARYKVPMPEPGELTFGKGAHTLRSPPNPNDVSVDGSGNIYVTDNSNGRLVKLGPDGSFLGTVGWEKGKEEWLVPVPGYIAVDAKGNKFVSTVSSVVVFGPDDKRLGEIGGLGQNVGDFAKVRGLAVDKDSRLFAADLQNGTIQVFEWNEKFRTFDPVAVLVNEEKTGNPRVSAPAGVALSPAGGDIFVVESMHKYVTKLKLTGTVPGIEKK